MRKEPANLREVTVQTDVCKQCDLVWLDGGELALLQLGHQRTSRFIDAGEYRRRMDQLDMSPERKAAFEADLQKLPEPENPFIAGM